MNKRIGITMRVSRISDYAESHDCVAHDWYRFLNYSLPDAEWVPLPNVGDSITNYLNKWEIGGVVLSGGNDIGESSMRDETECAIIEWALSKERPVFGVCRGLQMIQKYFQGQISSCSKKDHVATTHSISFTADRFPFIRKGQCVDVNSYHNYGVSYNDLAPVLRPFAISKDGLVEGLYHSKRNIIAIQWHPERNKTFSEIDMMLLRSSMEIA